MNALPDGLRAHWSSMA